MMANRNKIIFGTIQSPLFKYMLNGNSQNFHPTFLSLLVSLCLINKFHSYQLHPSRQYKNNMSNPRAITTRRIKCFKTSIQEYAVYRQLHVPVRSPPPPEPSESAIISRISERLNVVLIAPILIFLRFIFFSPLFSVSL